MNCGLIICQPLCRPLLRAARRWTPKSPCRTWTVASAAPASSTAARHAPPKVRIQLGAGANWVKVGITYYVCDCIWYIIHIFHDRISYPLVMCIYIYCVYIYTHYGWTPVKAPFRSSTSQVRTPARCVPRATVWRQMGSARTPTCCTGAWPLDFVRRKAGGWEIPKMFFFFLTKKNGYLSTHMLNADGTSGVEMRQLRGGKQAYGDFKGS